MVRFFNEYKARLYVKISFVVSKPIPKMTPILQEKLVRPPPPSPQPIRVNLDETGSLQTDSDVSNLLYWKLQCLIEKLKRQYL